MQKSALLLYNNHSRSNQAVTPFVRQFLWAPWVSLFHFFVSSFSVFLTCTQLTPNPCRPYVTSDKLWLFPEQTHTHTHACPLARSWTDFQNYTSVPAAHHHMSCSVTWRASQLSRFKDLSGAQFSSPMMVPSVSSVAKCLCRYPQLSNVLTPPSVPLSFLKCPPFK